VPEAAAPAASGTDIDDPTIDDRDSPRGGRE